MVLFNQRSVKKASNDRCWETTSLTSHFCSRWCFHAIAFADSIRIVRLALVTELTGYWKVFLRHSTFLVLALTFVLWTYLYYYVLRFKWFYLEMIRCRVLFLVIVRELPFIVYMDIPHVSFFFLREITCFNNNKCSLNRVWL